MRVTTLSSVTEQMIFPKKINEISYYEPYSIATALFTLPHTLTIPLLHTIQQQLAKRSSRRVRSTSQKRESQNENSYFTPHLIAMSSFAPRYAPAIPFTHSIAATSNKTQYLTHTEFCKTMCPFSYKIGLVTVSKWCCTSLLYTAIFMCELKGSITSTSDNTVVLSLQN